jgi:hypothetical protein
VAALVAIFVLIEPLNAVLLEIVFEPTPALAAPPAELDENANTGAELKDCEGVAIEKLGIDMDGIKTTGILLLMQVW